MPTAYSDHEDDPETIAIVFSLASEVHEPSPASIELRSRAAVRAAGVRAGTDPGDEEGEQQATHPGEPADSADDLAARLQDIAARLRASGRGLG